MEGGLGMPKSALDLVDATEVCPHLPDAPHLPGGCKASGTDQKV